jgi:PQQ-dependent catabolism-associated CXXCW motif protein
VLPRPPKPRNLPAGTIWHEKPRLDVPGSVWLPDTGYGALAPPVEAYLRAGLKKATGGDRDRALVMYCQRNCWMSWNAAKRALSIGYANVIWYPDGTDGWSVAGLPLKAVTPEPRAGE